MLFTAIMTLAIMNGLGLPKCSIMDAHGYACIVRKPNGRLSDTLIDISAYNEVMFDSIKTTRINSYNNKYYISTTPAYFLGQYAWQQKLIQETQFMEVNVCGQ